VTLIRLASQVVRLGFYMGYAPPGRNPLELIALAQQAERLGYDSAWATGGMGARGKNFYNDLFARYGYEAEAKEIQDVYLDGKHHDAAARVPDAFVDDVALVGSREPIADRLAARSESGATTLVVSGRDEATLRTLAEAAQ
jgi:alkanesulfonate monooxygenase SsuD/methylene tetrahydromethanopterin reductase-like flavin-dependent oxidoreductase (luciferase family)